MIKHTALTETTVYHHGVRRQANTFKVPQNFADFANSFKTLRLYLLSEAQKLAEELDPTKSGMAQISGFKSSCDSMRQLHSRHFIGGGQFGLRA